MTEIPEHLRRRAEQARERAASQKQRDQMHQVADDYLQTNWPHNHELDNDEGESSESSAQLSIGQLVADNLVIEVGMPVCSIAASDIAQDAEHLFTKKEWGTVHDSKTGFTVDRPAKQDNVKLYNYDAEGEFSEQTKDLGYLGGGFITAAGREVQLALARDTHANSSFRKKNALHDTGKINLVAIVRNDVVFNLVSFSRDNRPYCDYLQFWGESRMSELESENFYGWRKDDTGSRFDTVQLVGKAFEDPSEKTLIALTEALKLDERLSACFGEYDEDTEQVLSRLYKMVGPGEKLELVKEFTNIKMDKVISDLTVKGIVEPVDANSFRKKIRLVRYPSSQPDSGLEKTYIIDKHTGITNEDSTKVSELDLRLIRELLAEKGNVTHLSTASEKKLIKRGSLATFVAALALDSTIVLPQESLGMPEKIAIILAGAGLTSYIAREFIKGWPGYNKPELSTTLKRALSAGEEEEV